MTASLQDRTSAPVEERAPERRRTTWTVRFGGLVIAVLVALGAFALAGRFVSLPDLNPFDRQTADRSQPPLLKSIRDLNRFTVAEGNFQVVVDVQKDRKYVPDFLLNERTLWVAAGSVESSVDFSRIGSGAIKVGPGVSGAADRAVTVTLPEPVLGAPRLDLARSYVFESNRGAVNRLQDAFGSGSDRTAELYRLADRRIAKAAQDTELVSRAEENTTAMLEGLLGSLGYTDVTVVYAG